MTLSLELIHVNKLVNTLNKGTIVGQSIFAHSAVVSHRTILPVISTYCKWYVPSYFDDLMWLRRQYTAAARVNL